MASSTLVPTPSVQETSTGFFQFFLNCLLLSRRKQPAKPPRLPITRGPWVFLTGRADL